MLGLGGFDCFGGGWLGGGNLVRDKAGIAFLEFCERSLGADRRSRGLGVARLNWVRDAMSVCLNLLFILSN